MKLLLTTLLVALFTPCVLEVKSVRSEKSTESKEESKVAKIQHKRRCHHSKHRSEPVTVTTTASPTTTTTEFCTPTPNGTPCSTDRDCIGCLSDSLRFKTSCSAGKCTCSLSGVPGNTRVCCDGFPTTTLGNCPAAETGGICLLNPDSYLGIGYCMHTRCRESSLATAAVGGLSGYGICG